MMGWALALPYDFTAPWEVFLCRYLTRETSSHRSQTNVAWISFGVCFLSFAPSMYSFLFLIQFSPIWSTCLLLTI